MNTAFFISLNRLNIFSGQLISSETKLILSLNFLRIGTGLILLYDWIQRSLYFAELYSESSPFNVTYVKNSGYLEPGKWSLFFAYPSDILSIVLFTVGLLASLLIVSGKFIKSGLLLSWILQLSIQNKNPFVLHSGDKLILLIIGILFFTDFKPNREPALKKKEDTYFAHIAILFLFISINLISGINKISSEWLQDSSAVFYAFSNENYSRIANSAILEIPILMKFLSVCVVLIELICPLMLLFGIRNKKLKAFALIPALSLQALMVLFFEISWFNVLMIVLTLCIYLMPIEFLFQNFKSSELLKFEKGKVMVNLKKYFALFLFLILLSNSIYSINFFPFKKIKEWMYVCALFQTDVNWNLFSPSVSKKSVLIYEVENNSKKQDLNSSVYNQKNHRMAKLRENILLLNDSELNHKLKQSFGDEKKIILGIKKPEKAFSNKYLVYRLELK